MPKVILYPERMGSASFVAHQFDHLILNPGVNEITPDELTKLQANPAYSDYRDKGGIEIQPEETVKPLEEKLPGVKTTVKRSLASDDD